MNIEQNISEIQAEYFDLIDGRLGVYLKEIPSLEDKKVIDYMNRKLTSQGLLVPTRWGHLSSFEYSVLSWTLDVKEFWKSRGERLMSLVKQLQPFCVQLFLPDQYENIYRDVRRLATLFDYVIVPDPAVGNWGEESFREQLDRQLILTNFRRAAVISRLKEIVLATDAPLLCLIVPPKRPDPGTAETAAVAFLAQIFEGINEEDNLNELFRLFAMTSPSDSKLRIADDRLLSDFVHQSFVGRSNLWLIKDKESGNITRQEVPFSGLKKEQWYPALPHTVFRRLDGLMEHIGTSFETGADPIVATPRWAVFKWHLSNNVSRSYSRKEFSEEELLAKALLSRKLYFLDDIPTAVLGKLREQQKLESLRNEIRTARKELKSLTIEGFLEKAEATANRLVDAIRAFDDELTGSKEMASASVKKSLRLVALSVLLQVVSVAVPPLTIPLAVAGVLVGGTSVREAINNHLAGKRHITTLRSRPIGILWEWQGKRSSRVPPKE